MSKKKIIFYSGSRADYGLLEPIIQRLYKKVDIYLVIGPHHFEKSFGKTIKYIKRKLFKKIFNCITKINYNNVDINKFIHSSLPHYKKTIQDINPDMVVVLGDRYEVLSFVIASFFQNKKICHLHGGEKTIGSFDDTIRHVITKFSNYHFTTNNRYQKRVLLMGENKQNIFNFGSIGAENVKKLNYLNKRKILSKLGIENNKDLILTTFHSETNTGKSYNLQIKIFLSALKKFKKYYFIFTSSNGDPGGAIFNSEIKKFVKYNKNSKFFYSLGTKNYLNIMKFSRMVLGNSSSAIIEAPSFGVPVLNVGSRQHGRELSKNINNCKLNKNLIQKGIEKVIKIKTKKQLNLNYKKNSLVNISNKIHSLAKQKNDFKHYYDNQ